MPQMNQFQTNLFKDLQDWFEQENISHLLNSHMIQLIYVGDEIISSFPLTAYGTNEKYAFLNAIRRWYTTFKRRLSQSIRIVGYATDADLRYLLSMMLVSGFFANLINSPITNHSLIFKVDIPKSWSWFYLSSNQLMLFAQDPIHICIKLRNRLLSDSAVVIMGNNVVTIDHLLRLIELQSKFKHNLVK